MVAALSLQFWPGPNHNLGGAPGATRGAQVASLNPVVEGRNWSWSAIDGADEYHVALFDDAGARAILVDACDPLNPVGSRA